DSITAGEIASAVAATKADSRFVEGSLFAVVSLNEPPKAQVLEGKPIRREAFVVLLDRDHNKTNEVIVDLEKNAVKTWKTVAGVQPSVVIEEYAIAPDLIKADPRFIEAMKKRGITDLSKVKVDAWAPGYLGDLADGSRIVRTIFFYHDEEDSNWYSRPIEGVVAILNLTKKQVLQVTDSGVVPISKDKGSLDPKSNAPLRPANKPLQIVQPEGPGFTLDGNDVAWDNWRFHFGLDPREGLVLHRVRWVEGEKERSVLYRASLSEMVVPYGDADPNWAWRSAFDVGEYGIGRLASPIARNVDAPENAVYLSFPVATDAGEVQTLRDAVAIFERDGGLLWKHYDIDRDYNESRRGRQLVVMFIATVGNYDYALNWIFHQDGTLEFRADLTGIMLTKGVADEVHESHSAHAVAPNLVAPHHQHFFNFRLDLDVDGVANSVYESNSRALEDGNPLGNAFVMESTKLASEKAAQRDLSLASQRKWKVVNGKSGYLLIPGDNSLPFVTANAPVRKRAAFLNHHFWATRFRDAEMHASGYYPNQSAGGDGLEKWTADDEPVDQQDVVVWYTTGVTHIPRAEEWPIMNVHQTGFKLVPAGFFTRNPAIHLP
ncbi:MAG TPA: primary-amine oxidase, partial [Thermoanaerobaculia bacterium]|nr:primary-amine oxidase [Thermoanaerobaculia bacterium]